MEQKITLELEQRRQAVKKTKVKNMKTNYQLVETRKRLEII